DGSLGSVTDELPRHRPAIAAVPSARCLPATAADVQVPGDAIRLPRLACIACLPTARPTVASEHAALWLPPPIRRSRLRLRCCREGRPTAVRQRRHTRRAALPALGQRVDRALAGADDPS